MNRRKPLFILYLCVWFFLCISIYSNGEADKYSEYFGTDALSSNYYNSFTLDDDRFDGIFTYGPYCNLHAGKYEITLNYSADTDDNYIDISENGKPLSEYENIKLDKGESKKIIKLELKNDVNNFELRTYYGGKGYFSVDGIDIKSEGRIFNDSLFVVFIVTVLFVLAGLKLFLSKEDRFGFDDSNVDYRILFGLILITVFISYPLFNSMIFNGHDTQVHVTRIEGIKNGLLDGQFPVRMHPQAVYEFGYGDAILYPELFLYIPAVLRILGVSMPLAYNTFCVLVNIATAAIAYFSFKNIFKEKHAGFLGAVLYLSAIYRMTNLYIRGAMGEGLACVFLPLIIYGLYEIFFGDSSKWIYFTLACTGVLQSHVLSVLMVAVFAIMFGIVFVTRLSDKKRLINLLKSCGLSVLLNLWFIVPFLQFNAQELSTDIMKRNLYNNSLQLINVLYPFPASEGWGLDLLNRSLEGMMSLTVGLPVIIGVVLLIYSLLFDKYNNGGKEGYNRRNTALVLMIFGFIALYLTSDFFPWYVLQNNNLFGDSVGVLQFPWRFLSSASVFLAGAGGYGIYAAGKKSRNMKMAVILTFLVVLVFAGHYLTDYTYNEPYMQKTDVITYEPKDAGEYLPKNTDRDNLEWRYKNNIGPETSGSEVVVMEYTKKGTHIDLTYHAYEEGGYIDVPLLGYIGYSAKTDKGESLETGLGENNLLRVYLGDNTQGSIKIRYGQSLLWSISFYISLWSFIAVLVFKFNKRKRIRITDILHK
ncbi:MAG: hypothetical protein Q4D26_01455 [Clostridia bacterium]|nr:hypothetical protein [Clostridia bacterium]